MTIRDKAGLDALFTDNDAGEIGYEDVQDLVDSAIGTRYQSSETGTVTLDRDDDVVLCSASGGAFTVTLPAVASFQHKVYTIMKTDSGGNAVTVDGNASETINGATTQALAAQYDSITIVCNGTAWFIIADTR